MTEIRKMIETARALRQQFKAAGHHVDAAACSIRIHALEDAMRAVERERGP